MSQNRPVHIGQPEPESPDWKIQDLFDGKVPCPLCGKVNDNLFPDLCSGCQSLRDLQTKTAPDGTTVIDTEGKEV